MRRRTINAGRRPVGPREKRDVTKKEVNHKVRKKNFCEGQLFRERNAKNRE